MKLSNYISNIKNKTDDIFRDNFFSGCVLVFCIVMLSLFPLFCIDRYFNISIAKFVFFMVSFVLLTGAYTYSNYNKDKTKTNKTIFTSTDYAAAIFLLIGVISTIFSRHPLASLAGKYNAGEYSYGRFGGLIFYTVCFVVYFFISRYLRYTKKLLSVFFTVGSAMFIMAVFQKLGYNVFGFYNGVSEEQQNAFIGTIGNVDFFSLFVLIVLSLSSCMFIISANKKYTVFYAFVSFISFMGLIAGNSAGVFFAVCVMICVLSVYCLKSIITILRFLYILLFFLLSFKIMNFLVINISAKNKEFEKIYDMLIKSTYIYILIAVIVFLILIFKFLNIKKYNPIRTMRFLRYADIAILSLGFIAFAYGIYYYSVKNTETDAGVFSNYFRFTDSWGSGRGFVWNNTIKAFFDGSIFNKLFGHGFENFYPVFDDVIQGRHFDAAHNEVLHHAICVGILGVAAYIAFVFSLVVRCFKGIKNRPELLCFAVCILCYFAASLGNLAQVMVTPLFFVVCGIAGAVLGGDFEGEKSIGYD